MRGLIYQARALCAEFLLELALTIAPSWACKINVAKVLLDYAQAAENELKKDIK